MKGKIPIYFGLLFLAFAIGLWNVSPTWSMTYVDALDRRVSLERPPKRIVSLAPSLTEMLYYLGLGDRVVGVTTFSDYPPEAARKPKVGSYAHLNVEKIIELNPDLVVGTKDGNSPTVIHLLEQAGIPVYIVNPRRVKDVGTTLYDMARLCGVEEKGRLLSQRLAHKVQYVQDKVKGLRRPLVFLQINLRPIITVNKNTIHNDVIRLAGGINMAENEPITYPTISLEEVLKRRPEVIVISSMERGGRFEKARQDWMRWKSIPAVRDNRVYLLDSDCLDRPSPRIIDGLETLARLLHPDLEWEGLGRE